MAVLVPKLAVDRRSQSAQARPATFTATATATATAMATATATATATGTTTATATETSDDPAEIVKQFRSLRSVAQAVGCMKALTSDLHSV